ncbi:ELL-associated factor 2 [Linum perenne]
MANNVKEEPKTAPQPDRWYDLTLGSSFKEDSSNKFRTLRYEFKPASIDKSKPGSLHKNKENRVSVEFQNNQHGKPKVTFEGSSEDYKENDAVLFFDGHTFRLEKLHRAVNKLRHLRQPGESSAAAAAAAAAAAVTQSGDPRLSPPVGKGVKPPQFGKPMSFPSIPVEVERIDVEKPPIPAPRISGKGLNDDRIEAPKVSAPLSPSSDEEDKEHLDIDIENLFGSISPCIDGMASENKDIDMTNDNDTEQRQNESDDEIADSGDEEHKGRNSAAEAPNAQVNNGDEDHNDKSKEGDQSSSSGSSSSGSSSSGSSSSGSASGSGSNSSSDNEESDDSINSI